MRYDVVIAGGGHNGLVAAAYLARAGKSVLVLEKLDHIGGLAISAEAFQGVDARLSRYSYLVALLPAKIIKDLGLDLTLRRRRIASYTPVGDGGLLIDHDDPAGTAASFARIGSPDHDAWGGYHEMIENAAGRIAPTLLQPLVSRAELRKAIDDERVWQGMFERPISEFVNEHFRSDVVRGIVLTDALIGTFADPDSDLLANRCYLYHLVGDGTGQWKVPVGGMGAVSHAIAQAARAAGAEIRTGCEVLDIAPSGEVTFTDGEQHTVTAGHVLVNMPPGKGQEGSQLKVNMVLARLPRLKDRDLDPTAAFTGTFHVNQSASQLALAFEQAARGEIPALPPAEIYCHTITDGSILGAGLHDSGAHTLTLFGTHMPARLFALPQARNTAIERTLGSLNSVLDEPIQDVLLRAPDRTPCIEAKTPLDLEKETGLPGGHIFHGDLSWPYREDDDHGPWGVETEHPRILLCGASAKRGGGVSGIPGHNAAMAVLDHGRRRVSKVVTTAWRGSP